MSDSAPVAAGADPRPASTRSMSLLAGLVRTARPKQWMKNVLVVAAPAAAGVLGHGDVIVDT
ncbi:MAG: decaprenyl-phosphate phosphoribosyltransferase, partial [Acidimicrobiia bacterium]|nr:decaprenyl-phosphate phosphoribosyltransferase [Acidimicrobiia bacterium]